MATKAAPLSESNPEVAARWLGNVKPDDQRTPEQFSMKARLDCWWWCGKDGHRTFAAPPREHQFSFHCPECLDERRAEYERIMDRPVAEMPDLVAGWQDERPYDGLRVSDLCGGVQGKSFGETFSVRCPGGHKIDTVISSFVSMGCPYCRGTETRQAPRQPLSERDPELAAIFHPTRNGDLTPDNTPENYRKPLWWKSVQCCGHEWQEAIRDRVLGRRPQAGRGHYYCPRCESVWGSLAWLDPELATEWHPDNKLTAWHVKPFSRGVVVKWRCSANPDHVWDAPVIDRSSGRLCPQCSTAGTSQMEKAFVVAAQAFDPEAEAARVERWRVDVLVPSLRLIIEYDGEYWHGTKHETDTRKTRDLISLGYRVARIRENDLPHLDLTSSRLRQVSFRPAFGNVEDTVQALVSWANGKA